MFSFAELRQWVIVAILAGLAGCTVHPPGEREERDAASQLGKPFEKRFEVREIPSLPANPTQEQIVEYALLSNADLEQRYWEWRAAIEQIPQDGTQTASLNIAAGTTITKGRASWGSTTLTLANDPMTDIKWPGKLDAGAKQALENARAAGHRFLKAKYELRSKVLSAYSDYALNAELIRLEETNIQLLKITAATSDARNRAGSASQQDVLKASNEVDLSQNDIANMQSQLPAEIAAINAFLNRSPYDPLPLPGDQLPGRTVAYQDIELIELAAKYSPELAALSEEIRGRGQGVRLAKLQYIPDFNFSAGTDLEGMAQSILGQATIPIFRYEALNAAIAQADANLRAAEAMRRQTAHDLAAQVVSDITTIRDADRQLELFHDVILPRARQAVEVGRSGYESGHSTLLDLLDSERSVIAIERLVANLKAIREKRLVDLEAFTTVDLSAKSSKPLLMQLH